MSLALLHYDALNSVDMITDGYGNTVERRSYDTWGKQRKVAWQSESPLEVMQLAITNRGYTGHEEIVEVGLVHMNGRVYDQELGRFISPDPIIQAPYVTNSFNRYSYVWNNPLKYTDPTGFSLRETWDKIKDAVRDFFGGGSDSSDSKKNGSKRNDNDHSQGSSANTTTGEQTTPDEEPADISETKKEEEESGVGSYIRSLIPGVEAYDLVQEGQYLDAVGSLAVDAVLTASGAGLGAVAFKAAGPLLKGGVKKAYNSIKNWASPGDAKGDTKSTLHNRGYKPQPGERTLEGYVSDAAKEKEIGLNTNSTGFDMTGPKQFKRFGADSHAGISPHVHQPIRNSTPKGPRGTTGSKTKNGGVTSPSPKDVKQLYDHLNNGKY